MSSRSGPREPRLRLHKASGKGRVILSGQHFYTKAAFDTPEAHAEYLDLLRRWKAGGKKPLRELVLPAEILHPVTVRDLVAAYEQHVEDRKLYRKHGEPTSQHGMLKLALKELVESCGDLPLRKFARAELVRHRDRLLRKTGLTEAGVNRKIGTIKRVMRWASERDLIIDQNLYSIEVMRAVRVPKRRRREPVPDDHIEKVLEKLSPTLRAMLQLQRLTGMRPGEVCAMRWRDIDQKPADVDPSDGLWRYTVASPKTEHHGQETSYLLNQECQDILKDFLKTPAAFLFVPKDTIQQRWPGGAEGLMKAATDRYNSMSYRQAIERACKAAKVPVFTPHQIRHAFLTVVANDPALGLAAASQAANHRSQETTLTYVHPDKRLAVRVALAKTWKRSKQA